MLICTHHPRRVHPAFLHPMLEKSWMQHRLWSPYASRLPSMRASWALADFSFLVKFHRFRSIETHWDQFFVISSWWLNKGCQWVIASLLCRSHSVSTNRCPHLQVTDQRHFAHVTWNYHSDFSDSWRPTNCLAATWNAHWTVKRCYFKFIFLCTWYTSFTALLSMEKIDLHDIRPLTTPSASVLRWKVKSSW